MAPVFDEDPFDLDEPLAASETPVVSGTMELGEELVATVVGVSGVEVLRVEVEVEVLLVEVSGAREATEVVVSGALVVTGVVLVARMGVLAVVVVGSTAETSSVVRRGALAVVLSVVVAASSSCEAGGGLQGKVWWGQRVWVVSAFGTANRVGIDQGVLAKWSWLIRQPLAAASSLETKRGGACA